MRSLLPTTTRTQSHMSESSDEGRAGLKFLYVLPVGTTKNCRYALDSSSDLFVLVQGVCPIFALQYLFVLLKGLAVFPKQRTLILPHHIWRLLILR
jgi:hypothetical protein